MRVMARVPGFRGIGLIACTSLLGACATVHYTVDDGRSVDETLVANIRAYGEASRALRPAIVRSAALDAADCEPEWELPFDVATSDELTESERVAWVRALKVDERLTVIAVAPTTAATAATALAVGDRIVDIEGYRADSGRKMTAALHDRRDSGRPFQVATAAGRRLRIEPVRVCRGRATIASPAEPAAQDYHWSYSLHPLDVFRQGLTADEALWAVLWTQGLSAEGGARMKTYQYGVLPAQFVVGVASILSGVGAVVQAAQAGGAAAAASQAGLVVATNVAAGAAVDFAQQQSVGMMETASRNRANLKGVAWVGGTVFDRADQWAFARMRELDADPLAALSLHLKLVKSGSADNAFVLDAERLPLLQAAAAEAGAAERIARLSNAGEPPEAPPQIDAMLAGLTTDTMPQASAMGGVLPDGDVVMKSLVMESPMPVQSRLDSR